MLLKCLLVMFLESQLSQDVNFPGTSTFLGSQLSQLFPGSQLFPSESTFPRKSNFPEGVIFSRGSQLFPRESSVPEGNYFS